MKLKWGGGENSPFFSVVIGSTGEFHSSVSKLNNFGYNCMTNVSVSMQLLILSIFLGLDDTQMRI